LLTDPNALRDTINAHLSMMEKQSIEPVDEKIYVINNDAVVVSMSKVTTITFKNGVQFTMPYAWTMLIVRRDGEWKIVKYIIKIFRINLQTHFIVTQFIVFFICLEN
jgi:hypothetical protein